MTPVNCHFHQSSLRDWFRVSLCPGAKAPGYFRVVPTGLDSHSLLTQDFRPGLSYSALSGWRFVDRDSSVILVS
jgi:hypothetical protein